MRSHNGCVGRDQLDLDEDPGKSVPKNVPEPVERLLGGAGVGWVGRDDSYVDGHGVKMRVKS